METPTVSVVLPFVAERNWLSQAIDSMLQQTFQDFELLLINNGNDPESMNTAETYSKTDKRITIIRESKTGIAHALNAGVTASKGSFIARMDADDISTPNRLYELVTLLEKNPQTGVVSSRVELFPSTETNQGFQRHVDWLNGIIDARQHLLQSFIDSPVAHPSVMMRSEIFKNHGNYNTGPIPEDYELWLRWMNKGVEFVKSEKVLLKWRDHPGRLTRSHGNYSESAFRETKASYLVDWITKNIEPDRKIIVCGSSPNIRSKIRLLESKGLNVAAVTDIKQHASNQRLFIPVDQLKNHKDAFILNLIARHDVRKSIRCFLSDIGRVEGLDFLMAG
ncbi:MAG: glycosyltransferase family 2 protein [Bacteroidota bacterium]